MWETFCSCGVVGRMAVESGFVLGFRSGKFVHGDEKNGTISSNAEYLY